MEAITVLNLSKKYCVYEKSEGFKNSLKDFFHRKYYFKEAVKNLSFKIDEGEIIGFLGENGAGKTTTLKMLSGVLHPSEGDIKILGFTPVERKKQFLKSIAFSMGNRQQLLWDLPARESFNYQREIYEIPGEIYRRNLDLLVGLLGVETLIDIQIRKLSMGERMKMELINNFLYDPRVIFLDEPTIGLDLITQKKIRQFLVDYNKEKKSTIILTSHYMDDIEATCNRVILLKEGQKMHDSTMQELLSTYACNKVIELTFEGRPDTKEVERFGKVISDEGLKIKILAPKEESNTVISNILNAFGNLTDISFSSIPFEQLIENLMAER